MEVLLAPILSTAVAAPSCKSCDGMRLVKGATGRKMNVGTSWELGYTETIPQQPPLCDDSRLPVIWVPNGAHA